MAVLNLQAFKDRIVKALTPWFLGREQDALIEAMRQASEETLEAVEVDTTGLQEQLTELYSNNGANLIGTASGNSVQEELDGKVDVAGDTMTGKLTNTASIHVPSGTMVLGAPLPENLYWNYTYPGNTYLTMDKATADNDASLVFTQGGRAKWEFGATTEGPGASPRIHMKVVRNPTANPADDQFLDVMLWDYDSGNVWVNNGYRLGVGTLPQERLHVAGFNVSGARVVSKFENYNTGAGSQSAAHVFQGVGTSWATGNDFGLNGGHNYFIQDGNSGNLRFFADANGVSIGGSTVAPTEILRADSTTGGFLPPRMTTAQRDAMGGKNAGLVIYNLTTNSLQYWTGAAWVSLVASTGGTVTSVAVANTTGLTWTGSPITTSGTLTPTLSANLQAWSGIAPATKADLASPAFTGTPTAPTPATADNDTSIATTAFVKAQGYTSNTGTVTSVAVANATGISWAGSPITGAGTLTPTLSANLQSWSGIAPASKLDSGTAFEDAFGSSPMYWATNAALDLDNLEPGQRVLVSTTGNSNVPPAIGGTGFWYVECHRIYTSDAYKRQIATNYNGAGRMYYRFNFNTGWSEWIEVWTQTTATNLGIGTIAFVPPPNNDFNDAYGMTRFFSGSNTLANRPADYTANMTMHYSSALSVQLSGTVTGASQLFYRYGGSGGWVGWKTVADLESAQTFTGAKTFQGTTVFDLSTSTSAVARFTQPGNSPAGSTVEITSPSSQPGITGLYAGTHRSDIRFQAGSVVIAPSSDTAAPTQGITITSAGTLAVSGASATIGGNSVWHAGNDGAGSGLDADLLDGAQLDANATASTVAQRTASSDLYARLFRSTFADQTTISGGIAYRVEAGTDNYIRFCNSPAAVKTWLSIDSRNAKLFVTTANAATTLSATHLNGSIEKSNTTAYTYTIAPSLGAQGDAITIVNSGTAGNITLARGAGVALYQNGVDANITIGPGSMLTIYRSATADRWIA